MMKFMKSLIVLTLLSNFIFSSCRTLRKEKEVKEEVTVEEVKKDSVVVKDTLKEKVKQEAKVVDKVSKEKENSGELEVKGNTDENNPFEFYNIQNGDTLSVTRIVGNAEFTIKNRWKDSNSNIQEKSAEVKIDKVAEVSRYIVSQDNIKNTAKEIKSITKEVTRPGMSFVTYLWLILLLILLIWLAWKNKHKLFRL